jgi:MFS family permease
MVLPASFPRAIPILTFFLLHEIGRGALPPILFTFSNRHLKDETRSTANSARVAASTLGRGVGLMISGFMTLYFPPLVIWRLSALALLVLSFYLWRKK